MMKPMDGLKFASHVLGNDWYWYLGEYGLNAGPDSWLTKTITQAYEALESTDQVILSAAFPKVYDGIRQEGMPAIFRLQEWLFDSLLEPYLGQRLSVYTTRQIFQELINIRKEQSAALQPDVATNIDIQTISETDDTIIDVSGEGQRIHYEEEQVSTVNPAPQQVTNQYDEENWKLGHRYKDKLGLSPREVSWLNRFWNPFNSFLAIEGCCIATIRLYLHCMKKLSAALEKKGTTISKQVKQLQESFMQSPTLDAYSFTYESHNIEAHIYLTIFRRSENRVREWYQHKRKVSHALSYAALAETFEQQIGALVTAILNDSSGTIDPPDREMELQLNEMNVTRWKIYFDQVTGSLNQENVAACAAQIDELGLMNEKNPSLEHIYYEASKAFAKADKLTGVRFYLKYIYADLHSDKIDNKQLGKTIQKALFSNEEQLRAFEEIANKLIETKDLPAALTAVAAIYEKKRKKITLDSEAIAAVRIQNLETVERLNVILQEDEASETTATEDMDTKEIAIQLTPQPATDKSLQDIVFVSGLDFNNNQTGLLSLFRENNCSLPVDEVNNYARSRNVFKNQLIESINDCCYEQLDDNLIEETEDRYEINEFYYQKIINLC